MKVSFRITFEGVTEQEAEWYTADGQPAEPTQEEFLEWVANWIRQGPVGFLVDHDGDLKSTVEVTTRAICPACSGKGDQGDTGNAHLRACNACDGEGEIEVSTAREVKP